MSELTRTQIKLIGRRNDWLVAELPDWAPDNPNFSPFVTLLAQRVPTWFADADPGYRCHVMADLDGKQSSLWVSSSLVGWEQDIRTATEQQADMDRKPEEGEFFVGDKVTVQAEVMKVGGGEVEIKILGRQHGHFVWVPPSIIEDVWSSNQVPTEPGFLLDHEVDIVTDAAYQQVWTRRKGKSAVIGQDRRYPPRWLSVEKGIYQGWDEVWQACDEEVYLLPVHDVKKL